MSDRPARAWWIRRHNRVNYTILAVIVLVLLYATFFR